MSNLELAIPEDVSKALAASPVADAAFAKMPPSHKRQWIDHIDEAKKQETRAARISKMVEQIEAKHSS